MCVKPFLVTLAALLSPLFANAQSDLVELTIQGPFRSLGGAPAKVDVRLPDGTAVQGLRASLDSRGHSSIEYCTFPKLLLSLEQGVPGLFDGQKDIKIGTHCAWYEGEDGERFFSPRPGEASTHREALAYRIQLELGLPGPRALPARIRYVSTEGTFHEMAPVSDVTKKAFVFEKPKAVARRLGLELAKFDRDRIAAPDVERIDRLAALRVYQFEGLVGNLDFRLPLHLEQGTETALLHNMELLDDGSALKPFSTDYDRSSFVTGYFEADNVLRDALGTDYRPERGICFNHVVSLVRDMKFRAAADDAEWRSAARSFLAKERAVREAVARAPVDDAGRALADCHVQAWFEVLKSL